MSHHIPLIKSLTTFYTLLIDLGHVPATSLWTPLVVAEDGSGWPRHPQHAINRAAAMARGFGDDVIDLAYRIPYLDIDEDIRLFIETSAVCYLKKSVVAARYQGKGDTSSDNDERKNEPEQLEEEDDPKGDGSNSWDYARDPTFQNENNFWEGRKMLVLTMGLVYGTELIYDLDDETIRAWRTQDAFGWQAAPAYSMASPQNQLYVWIRDLLLLQNIPSGNSFLRPLPEGELSYSWQDMQWRIMLAKMAKERNLKDVFVACGWKTDTIANDAHAGAEDNPLIWQSLEESRKRAAEGFRLDEFQVAEKAWREEFRATTKDPFREMHDLFRGMDDEMSAKIAEENASEAHVIDATVDTPTNPAIPPSDEL